MERIIINKLVEWKNKKDRKPLILNGARQTGKTWILKERLYSLLLLNVELQEAIKNLGIDIEGFLTDVINIRNMYAHCSDRKINKLQKVDYYKYSVIINFMIRTLLIKNVLGLTQVVIDIEEL